MLDYISKYGIHVKPEKIFSLEDTAEAHAYLESSHSFGKVIILN
ncbi:zinc-binding dehydrogenase [Listeria portnoyi]